MQNYKHTYVKTQPKAKIEFEPRNKEEKQYLRKLVELQHLKRKGDWVLVGEICDISSKNAEVAFCRVHSKYHHQVVKALEQIIEGRLKMINDSIK